MVKNYFLIGLMVFVTSLVSAENPLIGNWKMEMFSVPSPLDCSFFNDDTYTLSNENGEQKLSYTYDNNSKTVDLEIVGYGMLSFSIDANENEIYLLLRKDIENPLIESILKQLESMRSINKVSRIFFDKLIGAYRVSLLDAPVFRLYKESVEDKN